MPIIQVKVIPGAKKSCVRSDGGQLKVYLTARPIDGKANDALIDYLADYYGVRKSAVTVVKGLRTRRKTVHIEDGVPAG